MSSATEPDHGPSPSTTAVMENQQQDLEKGPKEVSKPPVMPEYPEGGLMGWLCVLGATFVRESSIQQARGNRVCMGGAHPRVFSVFCTFGYANTFGVFQEYYQLVAYTNKTASDISWIGSVQLFFQFSLGAVAGPLYDKGYFRHLMVVGIVLYVVS